MLNIKCNFSVSVLKIVCDSISFFHEKINSLLSILALNVETTDSINEDILTEITESGDSPASISADKKMFLS